MSKTSGSLEPDGSLPQQGLSRASFLRLIGAGVGVSFVPASLAALGASGTAAAATSRVPTILADQEYPIGLWWPPPPSKTTAGRYQEIAEAGFNFVIGGNGVKDDDTNPRALNAAAASNLRFLLTDGRLQRIIRESTYGASARTLEAGTLSILQYLLELDESQEAQRAASDPMEEVRLRIQGLLARYAEYPALAGLNLFDEPSKEMFGIVGYAREVLRRRAPVELPYANVWPSYAPPSALGTSSYREYLEHYLSKVRPPLLCFDHYPLLSGTQITPDYFYNWALIRRFSLRFDVPSWVFIQSVGFDGSRVGLAKRRRPNEAEVRWQVNTGLAYGAKGIQYFTYWTPDLPPNDPVRFGEALVSVNGRRTQLYDYAQRINRYLRVVGKVLLPLTSESVAHAGEKSLPRGAAAFKGDRYVKSAAGSPVILSRFRKPGVRTERHLFVANRSFAKHAETRLRLSGSVKVVYELDTKTGRYRKVSRKLRPKIVPGGARLYLLRTG